MPVFVNVKINRGIVFFKENGNGETLEGFPSIGIAGPRACFDSKVCTIDVPVTNKLFRIDTTVACRLEPSSHLFTSASKFVIPNDAYLSLFLSSHQSIANNGYPITKDVAHAINPPTLKDVAEKWTGLVVFMDMAAYQEIDYEKHLGGMLAKTIQDGVVVQDLWWDKKIFGDNVQPDRYDHLPVYVRGAISVTLSLTVDGSIPFSFVSREFPETSAADKQLVMYSHRFATYSDNGNDYIQGHMKHYMHEASKPYTGRNPWNSFAPYTKAWRRFVVPEYVTSTGMMLPASTIAMGTVYPQSVTLEQFVFDGINTACKQLGINLFDHMRAMKKIAKVYHARRKNNFTFNPKSSKVTMDVAPMDAEWIDIFTRTVNVLFTETTASMSYATDESTILGERPNKPYTQAAKKIAPNDQMEVERIIIDLFRCKGFDCEDGSLFHFRLHVWICLNRFSCSEPAVCAFADVMDLYLPCVSKMQCGGDPKRDPEDKLVCHILSDMILRDHAYEMLMHGVRYSPEFKNDTEKVLEVQAAMAECAYFSQELYQGPNVIHSDILTPLITDANEWIAHNHAKRHYGLPLFLCTEPTAPVPCTQMPNEFTYSDLTLRELRQIRPHQTDLIGRTQRVFSTGDSATSFPVENAFPSKTISVGQARQYPFKHAYSRFYKGWLSLWIPDSEFLSTLHGLEATNNGTDPFNVKFPTRDTFLDFVCCILPKTSDHTIQYGVPHNIVMTQDGSFSGRNESMILVPSKPFSPALCYSACVILSNEKCPEVPILPTLSDYNRMHIARQRMPNFSTLAARYPLDVSNAVDSTDPHHPITDIMFVVPSDAQLFHERQEARRLQNALENNTFHSVRILVSPISKPTFERSRPLLPNHIVEKILTILKYNRENTMESTSHHYLTYLSGMELRNHPEQYRAALIDALGSKYKHLATDSNLHVILRAIAQYLLEHVVIVRHSIIVAL